MNVVAGCVDVCVSVCGGWRWGGEQAGVGVDVCVCG